MIKKICENSAVKNLYKFYKNEMKSKKSMLNKINIYFGNKLFLGSSQRTPQFKLCNNKKYMPKKVFKKRNDEISWRKKCENLTHKTY